MEGGLATIVLMDTTTCSNLTGQAWKAQAKYFTCLCPLIRQG